MTSVGVIGGGIVGLLSAWRMQQRGLSVTVYDKSNIGREASWAAAGLLAPSVEKAPAYAFASRDAYPALLAELGGDVPYARCGLAMDGAWYPDEAWVDPRALVTAVGNAASAAGVVFKRQRVDTNIPHDLVVVAAGAWSSEICDVPVKPMKGVLLRVKAHVPHIHFWHGGYVVPRPHGECIVGTTMEDVGFDRSITAQPAKVLEQASERVAELRQAGQAAILDQWAGFRPYAEDVILKREGRVIIATGHHRNGILLAPYTADWVCASAMAQSGK